MVGYASNGYRLWNPKTNEIILSRDTTFDENNFKFRFADFQTLGLEMTIETQTNDDSEQKESENTTQESVVEKQSSENQIETDNDLRRSSRKKTIPSKLKDYDLTRIDEEDEDENNLHLSYCLYAGIPHTYEEAIHSNESWEKAIQTEIEALEKYETWESADSPKSKPIETCWVFTIKPDGTKKARLVAKGYQEQVSHNIYAPVAQMPTIRMLLSVALQNGWDVKQLDVPTATAFLNLQLF